jgi:hypothetical protein
MTLGQLRKAMILLGVTSIVGIMSGLPAWSQEDPTSKVSFLIVRDSNGKPIRAASVVLHPVTRKGKQQRGGFELKTDNDGKTEFEGVPYGKMRIQVLAPGFQTYGDDYDINKPEMDVVVKLKRPADQYSVYNNDDSNTPKKDAPKAEDKPGEAKPQ